MPSLTIENYVKTIYLICKSHGGTPAATGEIAERLDVSPGTVTSMLKTLNETGLAEHKPYEGVLLTQSGRSLALRVLRRHRLIEVFLVQTLELTWDEVHDEAENLEHAVSDLLIDRIDEFLGFPDTDPYGDPIPKQDGTIREISKTLKSISELSEGDSFRLERVTDQSMEFLRFLTEQKLTVGVRGRLIKNCEQSGVIQVALSEGEATLSAIVAEKLKVELLIEMA